MLSAPVPAQLCSSSGHPMAAANQQCPRLPAGAVYPVDGKIAKEKGRRVKKLGPVTGWSIKFASQSPEVEFFPGKLTALITPVALHSSASSHLCYAELLWPFFQSSMGAVQVCVTTAKAVYSLGKAATAYRAIFEHLSEAVAVTLHCYMALAPSAGGNPQASLSEVVAKLARAKVRC